MLQDCVVILRPTKFYKASANITSAIALPCCKGLNKMCQLILEKNFCEVVLKKERNRKCSIVYVMQMICRFSSSDTLNWN